MREVLPGRGDVLIGSPVGFVDDAVAGNVAQPEGDPVPPLPNSPNESALNASFIVRITGVGRYGYHCAYHGGVSSGVFGVIVTE